ncbi:hypothetical protein RFI_35755, partial [Reticulomyxa filosa]
KKKENRRNKRMHHIHPCHMGIEIPLIVPSNFNTMGIYGKVSEVMLPQQCWSYRRRDPMQSESFDEDKDKNKDKDDNNSDNGNDNDNDNDNEEHEEEEKRAEGEEKKIEERRRKKSKSKRKRKKEKEIAITITTMAMTMTTKRHIFGETCMVVYCDVCWRKCISIGTACSQSLCRSSKYGNCNKCNRFPM